VRCVTLIKLINQQIFIFAVIIKAND